MSFLIITSVIHKINSKNQIGSYGPYIKEMNLWVKYVDKVVVLAPIRNEELTEIDLPFNCSSLEFRRIPDFNIVSFKGIIKTIVVLPYISVKVLHAMRLADHIHIRCPNNIGLIGCLIQFFFPKKKKTAKYAGNWDWNSRQPWSYRLQQRILRNTFLTRNMTALVYGDWPDMTKNIMPFFTASYSEKDKQTVSKKPLSEVINLAFVGTLTKNKSPLTSLEVLRELTDKGINATLTYCGEGPERTMIAKKIQEYSLEDKTTLLGNVDAETVKGVLRESHFLVFISRSEGWPKAVSEAMWWGCLPITTPVSCVPQMLGNGSRGDLANGNVQQIYDIITGYMSNQSGYREKYENAMAWAREFTIEKFEEEIKTLILN